MSAAPLAIHYFSPMPPVRSGIADYSHELLPHLAELLAVRLAASPEEPTEAQELPLYQIGNNVHHAGIYHRALHEPGVSVLHDTTLHHLIGEVTLKEGLEDDYFFTIAYGHGAAGAATAAARLHGVFGAYQQFVLPAHALVGDRSLAVVVHSHAGARQLRESCPDVPVFRVPMGVPMPPPIGAADVAAARERLGIPHDAFVVASFGFVSPIKRVDTLLRAFHRLAADVPHARLFVVGEILPFVDVQSVMHDLGLGGRAELTGFVPFDRWIDYLVACDVCVNLRFPTAGETSASLIRILGHGKPVLVSRYRQFREIPDGAAGFVDLGAAEEPLLHAYLERLARDPALRASMGQAARRFAQGEHSLGGAAAAYRAVLEDVAGDRAALRARVAGRRPRIAPWRRTSRIPGKMSAEVDVVSGVPSALPAGGVVPLRVDVRNSGDTLWLRNTGGDRGGFVVLNARFFHDNLEVPAAAAGSDVFRAEQWFDLPRDVAPGERVRLAVALGAPAARGELELELDMRVVGIGRFERLGGAPVRRRVRLS